MSASYRLPPKPVWTAFVASVRRGEPAALPTGTLFSSTEALSYHLSHLSAAHDGARILELALGHRHVEAFVKRHVGRGYVRPTHPLAWAIRLQSLKALRTLLGMSTAWACLRTEIPGPKGPTREDGPLPDALRRGWLEGVQAPVEAGARTEDSPLAIDAIAAQPAMVAWLLECGLGGELMDVHHRDRRGQTLLGRMARQIKNHLFVRKVARLAGDDWTAWTQTGCMLAARGAPFFVPDGRTARSTPVVNLWVREAGAEAATLVAQAAKAWKTAEALEQNVPAPPSGNVGKQRAAERF